MAAMGNGFAVHGGVRPYVATFFVFADYMRPAMRLAALMGLPVTYVFTHDSIGVGEDGPTHQPIEHLAMLRAMPNCHGPSSRRRQRDRRGLEVRPAARRRPCRRSCSPVRTCPPSTARSTRRRAASPVAHTSRQTPPRAAPGRDPHGQRQRGRAGPRGARRLVAEGVRSRVVNMASWQLFEAPERRLPRGRAAARRAAAGWPSRPASRWAGSAGSATAARSWPRPLRRLGPGRDPVRAVRLHRRQRVPAGQGSARPHRRVGARAIRASTGAPPCGAPVRSAASMRRVDPLTAGCGNV